MHPSLLAAENGPLSHSQPAAQPRPAWLEALEGALGFADVTAALAAQAGSALGKAACATLPWLSDAQAIAQALQRIEEARALSAAGVALPAGPSYDVRPQLAQAVRGAVLTGGELNQIADVCAASEQVRTFARSERAAWPALAAAGQSLRPLAELVTTLQGALHADGSLKDEASAALAAARAAAHAADARLRARMEEALQDPAVAPHLQDDFVSLRNARYVLPVVASFQAKVPGIVHNVSQTGQTLFVEPEQVVAQGNALLVLRARVQDEEARVLQLLSQEVAAAQADVSFALEVLVALDVTLAGARLADLLRWHVPELVAADGPLHLPGLRHPELQRRGAGVVANDVTLKGAGHALMLSGPNAGGKTVTLRAVGLCLRMVQAGLPLPTAPGARVPVVKKLLAQVGDAQDLGRGHSSFHAHLLGLRAALAAAAPGTCVLIDEVGKDTDPVEGTALAHAVLRALVDGGAAVLATTHLDGLKTLAHRDSRFNNARMGLDPTSLLPNYQLAAGTAGSSHAFAVAERLGLPAAVLNQARALLHGDDGELAQVLARLEAAEQRAESERQRLLAERRELATALAAVAAQREEAATELEALRREDARRLAQALTDAASQLGRLLQGAYGPQAAQQQRAEWQRQAAKAKTAAGPAPVAGAAAPPVLAASGAPAPGSMVWLTTLARSGELVAVAGETAVVALGNMRTRVPVGTVRPLKGPPKGLAKGSAKDLAGSRRPTAGGRPTTALVRAPADDDVAAAAASGRCDVRGLRVEQAEASVVRALDACLSEGAGQLWVVHGHGTGALRERVRRLLRASPYVAQIRAGAAHEGGDGVTVASFEAPPSTDVG